MPSPRKELRNGRYVLVRLLGEGGQGDTYEAIDKGAEHTSGPHEEALTAKWDRYVGRARAGNARSARGVSDVREPAARESGHLVAIKCFRLKKAKAWKDVELAEREARTLASLDHPRLPRYIEHFEEDGALYLVMEKVEGESVAALGRKRTWSTDEVTKMIEDVGDALRYLHGRSPFIIHRDIKPGNVIRRPDGSYALVDFGAVRDRLSPAGGSTVVGTFGYMAPEQFQGRASPKSDVYGLGATALAMLTGCEPEDLPHEGLGIDVQRAVPKGTPAPLVRALTAMLTFDPDRRLDSIEDALVLLRVAKTPVTRSENRRLRKERRRAAREERRRLRRAARARSAPLVPRLIAQLALLVARLVVWITVGLALPLALVLLSLVFGGRLRRAARACMRAARRAQSRLGDASAWLSGHRSEARGEGPRIRVGPDLDQVRAVTEQQDDAAVPNALLEEHLGMEVESEAESARLRLRNSTPRPGLKRR